MQATKKELLKELKAMTDFAYELAMKAFWKWRRTVKRACPYLIL